MAATSIDVSLPSIMRSITLRIRFARVAGVRLWCATWIMRLAGLVAGCDVEVSTDGDQELEFTEDGLPRALSIDEGFKGFRRDAVFYGTDLVIKLDGVEQHDVLSYDIDAGRVTTARRGEAGEVRLLRMGEEGRGGIATVHRKGVVTVERRVRDRTA